uniref:mRNA export factor n=1 Tax=Polytomella parva TaxID=51329 RepID=A0A7S0YJK6_9CHLO|mmetsp:Transcript_32552/g.59079  ORF Transcript_32552/g.59079 Transcript_32552/m.59079 type:complete len:359 (+) Transcript_32552:108-1184(+)|eukprot:CAMPEP_0175050684 /NCGR_PEP_ID=MMETSP0052_2-20121109/7391_1 /TAXON_ID=51329 ORGANISM="Polytomella parva, Strain SAG 63-3" /NCGR_SAMPLE_ID=MMETSP0052_2 /ASSEMBLY_ACC=CAM_ASM_000194 /LENGTH=358 /DNA_ID=CAMNT_0016314905 /DNA_START=80 /DNA_END=1156 /DNA_ORIENTATION=-
MFGAIPQQNQAVPRHNPNKDAEVQTPPEIDGISSISFNPAGNHFVATSWDNNSYVWEYSNTLQTIGKAQNAGTQPSLCSAWRPDGTAVFLGGCDNCVRLWDLGSNQTQQVAQHEAPVRTCAFINSHNMLATGGWDKKLCYWDLRQPKAVHTQQLSDKVTCMDVKDEYMVLVTADRNVHIFNMSRPTELARPSFTSSLKMQVRVVKIFPDKKGFIAASIEGRVAVVYFNETPTAKNFTFKCHRDNNEAFSVNSLEFFPQTGTFLSAGSDGVINFWDKDTKQRLKALEKCCYSVGNQVIPASIACTAVDRTNTILAYAVSYDWSRGYSIYHPSVMKNHILLHQIKEEEIKPKPKPNTYRR